MTQSVGTAAVLALEDGTVFHGRSIGAKGNTTGEVVFNTAMTGYQEILTDPSYCRQLVTLTYPHIGNTGTNAVDVESNRIYAAGLIIRDLPLLPSSWRKQWTLADYLLQHDVPAIAGIERSGRMRRVSFPTEAEVRGRCPRCPDLRRPRCDARPSAPRAPGGAIPCSAVAPCALLPSYAC